MGSFDWRRTRRAWSVERIRPPWGDRVAIYAHIRDHLGPDGSLLARFHELPDHGREAPVPPAAPGARDGVLGHHVDLDDDELRARQLVGALRSLLRHASEANLDHFYRLVTRGDILTVIDRFLELVGSSPPSHLDRFARVASLLVKRAPDREAVKAGIAMVGALGVIPEVEVLETLGVHDELTLYVAVAILGHAGATERLTALARRVHGWGRIHILERLTPTEDVAAQGWLLRDGYANDVAHEYTAHICARVGRLHEALAAEVIDDRLFDGAGAILVALASGAPGPGMSAYPEAELALARWLGHAATRALSVRSLAQVVALRDYLLEPGGADGEHVALISACDELLDRESVLEVVIVGLAAEDPDTFFDADVVARAFGIDTWAAHVARVRAGELASWYALSEAVGPARVADFVALADQTIDLARIATGPAREKGLGPEFAPHISLRFIVEALSRFPGVGAPLVGAALQSPVVRDRLGALRTVRAWPAEHRAPSLIAGVERARDGDPHEAVCAAAAAALASSAPGGATE